MSESQLPLLYRSTQIGGTDAEVETQAYGPIEIVNTYGVPQAEYAAIHKACGLLDETQRGVLEVGGKDRAAFLNNFLTNETWSKATKQGMPAGTGVYAFLLNGKGRVVADMNVLELGDKIYLEMDRRLIPTVRSVLEKYVFTEKVTFATPEVRVLGMYGPGAIGVLQEAGATLAELAELAVRAVGVGGATCWAAGDATCGAGGVKLMVPAGDVGGDVGKVWEALVKPYQEQTNKRTLRPVGWAMFNACRIEAGRPIFGIDFSDESLPAETGAFERAVSVTKGCYLGQEIVARMYARQQVAKRLVGLRMEDDALPTSGAEVLTESGDRVGQVSSSTLSPVLGRAAIALATVKKGFFEEGTVVKVPAEGAMRTAKVVGLPFVGAVQQPA
jgi:folate-binding protein YgfZ